MPLLVTHSILQTGHTSFSDRHTFPGHTQYRTNWSQVMCTPFLVSHSIVQTAHVIYTPFLVIHTIVQTAHTWCTRLSWSHIVSYKLVTGNVHTFPGPVYTDSILGSNWSHVIHIHAIVCLWQSLFLAFQSTTKCGQRRECVVWGKDATQITTSRCLWSQAERRK